MTVHKNPARQNRPPEGLRSSWPNADQIRFLIVVSVTALGLYLCYLLTVPFLASLTWALVLSVTFSHAHQNIEMRIKQPNLAAGISVAAILILVVFPVVLVVQQLVQETAKGAVYIESQIRNEEWREALAGQPILTRAVHWLEQQLDLAGTAGSISSYLTTLGTSVLLNSISQFLNLVLTFYMLFFFLRDRAEIVRKLQSLSSLTSTETRYVLSRFVDTIHATVFGKLVVAAVQGTLSGLMFWWLGLPLPILWGAVMAMLSIVPVLGAFVVWVPAAIYLALEGDWGKALILTAWGVGVVATIDNILYPMLVGDRLKLHAVPTFIGAIGGILAFGAAGLILGPAVISVTLALIMILKKRFDRELEIVEGV
jgi:predicted PurR-regulated permease PerM